MDLTGKIFRNKSTIVYVEGVKKSKPNKLYNCISLEKYAFGYIIGRFVNLEENIIRIYPTEINTNIIFKVKSMLHMNYIACCNIASNIEIVESSKYVIRIASRLLLWGGTYGIDVYSDYIRLRPVNDFYWLYGLGDHISKKDYNKIFRKVKKLKEDIDKLWADVV